MESSSSDRHSANLQAMTVRRQGSGESDGRCLGMQMFLSFQSSRNLAQLRGGMDVGMLFVKQGLQPYRQGYKIGPCAGTVLQQGRQVSVHENRIPLLRRQFVPERRSGHRDCSTAHFVPVSCFLSRWTAFQIYPGFPGIHRMPCDHLRSSMRKQKTLNTISKME